MIKKYYELVKPGIIYGNAVTAAAGFFVASKNHINWMLFLAMLIGQSLIIASGCVFNNYIDRGIDSKMQRTKERVMVKGEISGKNAIIFGVILGVLGAAVLWKFTNLLTLAVILVGLVFYVAVYTPVKRLSVHGTVLGSIAGAVPPVVGYTAVTNRLDAEAIILFLILVLWQMPHFYAIAIYRLDDYASAGIPVLPIKTGIRNTKIGILVYIAAFTAAMLTLELLGYAGIAYAIIAAILGLGWLSMGIFGFKTVNEKLWARKMFFISLIVLTLFCVTVSFDALLRL